MIDRVQYHLLRVFYSHSSTCCKNLEGPINRLLNFQLKLNFVMCIMVCSKYAFNCFNHFYILSDFWLPIWLPFQDISIPHYVNVSSLLCLLTCFWHKRKTYTFIYSFSQLQEKKNETQSQRQIGCVYTHSMINNR